MYDGLVDKRAYLNTLGCLMLNPTLVDDIDRPLDRTDFNTESFYELLYVAIYNLVIEGCEKIDEFNIDSYLSNYSDQYKIFQDNNGIDYLTNAKDMASIENYDYYYHRLRKFSLLRYYEKKGLDTRFIYDPADSVSNEEQKKIDEYTEQDIVEMVENTFVLNPKNAYCSNALTKNIQAGFGLLNLIDDLMETPDYGYSFTSIAFNTICRGARKGKFYLRSGSTGVSKTRQFLMDACNFAIPYTYDLKKKKFIHTGHNTPTLYVGTEGSLEEFQTIVLATVSGVNEEHILQGEYDDGELERVRQAAQYIQESPLYLVYCDDYSISDIENIAKKYVYQFQIEIMLFDYLQTSLRLVAEVTSKIRMQEYQLLIVFATRMKALAERLNICLISGTQLNGEADDAKYKTQHVLQGSKAVAQKVDIGCIISVPNSAEKRKLETIYRQKVGLPEINLLTWCYKVRAGKLTRVIICSHIDLGTMRIKDCFVTDFDFNLIDIDFTEIEVVDEIIQQNSKPMRDEDFREEPEIEEDEEETKVNRGFDW